MNTPYVLLAAMALLSLAPASAASAPQKKPVFRHVSKNVVADKAAPASDPHPEEADSAMLRVRDVEEIVESLGAPDFRPTPIDKTLGPWVFLGYRNTVHQQPVYSLPAWVPGTKVLTNDSVPEDVTDLLDNVREDELTDSVPDYEQLLLEVEAEQARQLPDYSQLTGDVTPKWLRDALTSYRIQEDLMYDIMMSNPKTIDYAYWDLPVPPRLLEDDYSFSGYIRRMELPEVATEKAILPEESLSRIHWLHTVRAGMQFSQAYVSKNWYQGGNNHLALLLNFGWNVKLNPVYHPNFLFESALSYKLGLNSTPQDEVHSYSISEDLFQYNLNAGLKAFKTKWFYSFNLQFKTQMLRNYEQNSMKRKASFLSPGDLNLGLGMAYSYQNKKKTLQLTTTISPVSYNLKTCISDKIDHGKFNISADRHSRSEFGSNGEMNMTWKVTPNIDYRMRLFLFTDYDYFLADWENTVQFNINRFLSTNIYVHARYDTSSDLSTSWKHFMLREILSFGLTYTFSTKP